ncbi:MAG: ribonuclease P protein component [Prevotella sp.]|nr:ribonuclease P protein component [Prevotella sp.]
MAPTLSKKERIVSNLLIETLFGQGNSESLAAYPIRVIYTQIEQQQDCAPVQILISVPKKRFKHAVDRNRVKRQVREAYRHHKQLLYNKVEEGKQLLVAFVWLSDKHMPSSEVEKKIKMLLEKIAAKI